MLKLKGYCVVCSAKKHSRWHMEQAETKVLTAENVCTGSIHETATKTFTRSGQFEVKVLHTCPQDTGHAAIRRFRGWSFGAKISSGINIYHHRFKPCSTNLKIVVVYSGNHWKSISLADLVFPSNLTQFNNQEVLC